jgi:hypothetical protein
VTAWPGKSSACSTDTFSSGSAPVAASTTGNDIAGQPASRLAAWRLA